MVGTVIVPLDGSEQAARALPVAVSVARAASARLVLFTATNGGVALEPRLYLQEQADAAGFADAELVVESTGTAAQGLTATVQHRPDPLVVMTTRGHTALGQAVLGSVAEEVLATGAAPVLLVGPHAVADAGEYGTLLVCDDGSDVADAIVPVAASFARALHLQPWVIQVVDPSARVPAVGGPPDAIVESGTVERVAKRLREAGVEPAYDVLHGRHADQAIVAYAKTATRPVIAMATHGRTGLARIRLGSVAMATVRHAPCPVLVARPARMTER